MQTIRLIELFAGYGSQAMALKRLGLPFEHHFVCEFDKYAIKSYNAVHGTNFPVLDIRDIHAEDLNITERDKYQYFMTYSFPCTDLSVAGKMQGMSRGSGTRSGLLWEVERLLKECGTELPQLLLMENVPQVHGANNIDDFAEWISFLDSLGYTSKWQDLNAKDFGVAQNRVRTFMVSWLGARKFYFPQPRPLYKTMRDYLEDDVAEKYYLKSDKVEKLISDLVESGQLERERERALTLCTETQRDSILQTRSKPHNEAYQDINKSQRECVSVNAKVFGGITYTARCISSFDKCFGASVQLQNGVLENEQPRADMS